MKTVYFKEPTKENIEAAAKIIRDGGLLAIPTETVYGLGADALNEDAVLRIFLAKGRPQDNPLIIHVPDSSWLARYCQNVPDAAYALAEKFWPGPLTMILPRKPIVPLRTTAGLETVGVRCPDHPVTRAIIAAADMPIAAPSGNTSGRPSPTCIADMIEDMDGKIEGVVDGGPCAVGVESTILDLTCDPPRLLRPGGLPLEDLERLIGRIVYGTAGGRDFASLRNSIERITEVKAQLTAFTTGRLHELDNELDTLTDVAQSIRDTLIDEPPFSVREGGFIRKGYNAEVDRLHEILSGGKGLLADIETREKEKTGIRTLKIGYNKVFGYYIEVSNSFKDLVPDTYIRKQTLVNGERYITEELKNLEQEILTAGDRDKALEFEIFTALRESVTAESVRIQRAAGLIAELDTLCSLASVAVNNNYCRPSVDDSGVIEIHDGRHPVVERVLKDALFVPNDTYMGEREDRAAIITGPNMAGKSTYMRQVALITLMAQIGSFVPAKSARIGVVDRIFTRIGASDDLAGGQSTFMVEMTEVSEILHQATPRSLLILDEIGRGTSTFDGMSIARAVLEFCADPKRLGAKTLFATHYHELTELEGVLPGVKNYSISIKKRGDELIFLRKIVPGGADRSYGIEVAKLAGLPNEVVRRANVILKELEQGGAYQAKPREETEQVSLDAIGEAEVLAAIRRAQPDTMSPIEAMQLLYELKQKLS